jgi:histidine ammonia-lyase
MGSRCVGFEGTGEVAVQISPRRSPYPIARFDPDRRKGWSIANEQVRLSSTPMGLDEVLAVADGAQVRLTDEALDLIRRSRSVVDAAIERGDAIYGVNTGVGHARNERLSPEVLVVWQPLLIEMHLGAIGDKLAPRLVRAGMVVRLNGFARGGAGVSLEVARTLETMLNQQIHPIIPRSGSVGTGDLGQLAYLGRALLGRGEVEWRGDRVPAADALRKVGSSPVTLQPKDALALISSNALTVGHGISLWRETGSLLALADLVAATSMEAIRANTSFFEPAVSEGRDSTGQVETSRNLREALDGSSLVDATGATSVQDPISFRVVPQVHGACRDVLTMMVRDLEKELNARSDNPLVDLETERVLSNGNFHAMNLALSAESLRLALSHVGLLSERRSSQVWNATVTSLGDLAGDETAMPPADETTPPFLAGLALRYPSAARYTRLRQLAQPVTLDVPPLDLSVEDHATNASEALQTTEEVVGIVTELLTVEALIAFANLFVSQSPGGLGTRTGRLIDLVTAEMGALPMGTLPDETADRVRDVLTSNVDAITASASARPN